MTAPLFSPPADAPETVFGELLEEIRSGIINHPRSLQKRIGPSEVGEPCARALIHKLAQHPEPERGPAWKPTVGTAIHQWIETTISASPLQQQWHRYLLETRVTVGQIGGIDITGSCDLYDTMTATAVDWKTKGRNTLRDHRRNGPGPQYRAQIHLYGRGMQLAGEKPRQVMIVFLPRDGELSDVFYWSEPYDEQVALDALARANQLHTLIETFGADQALALYPPCDGEWCDWCRPPRALDARPHHGARRSGGTPSSLDGILLPTT